MQYNRVHANLNRSRWQEPEICVSLEVAPERSSQPGLEVRQSVHGFGRRRGEEVGPSSGKPFAPPMDSFVSRSALFSVSAGHRTDALRAGPPETKWVCVSARSPEPPEYGVALVA